MRKESDYAPDISEEEIREQAEIDELRETCPAEAETKLHYHHYEQGVFGWDWLSSSYYGDDYDSVPHEISDSSLPLQIVRWKMVGYELPNPCVWSADYFENDSIYPSFADDPDFKIIEKVICEDSVAPEVELFASDSNDPYGVERHPELGWKPLLNFSGPISGAVLDVHTVFYRKIDGVVEYAGACIRCH